MTLHSEHSVTVAAAPEVLFGLIGDVTLWPAIFEPTVHAKHLRRAPGEERFQLWALARGELKTWVSRRSLDPGRRYITFEQERTQAPIASMSGSWTFHPSGGGTVVVLAHDFTAVGNGEHDEWLVSAVDVNSNRELAALRRIAELGHAVTDVVVSFEDEMRLQGSADDAYSFIDRSDLWPQRLRHVARVSLLEPQPGVQYMEMDTMTSDGSTHTTRSVRLCFPPGQIVYKQLVTPELLLGHSGSWQLTRRDGGDVATARHTVVINPDAVPRVLGADRTLADAQAFVRDALGANSRATMSRASEYAGQLAASGRNGAVP
jgi:ribosome-associated toxin RatA of RatAB toxin-antitoxin module